MVQEPGTRKVHFSAVACLHILSARYPPELGPLSQEAVDVTTSRMHDANNILKRAATISGQFDLLTDP